MVGTHGVEHDQHNVRGVLVPGQGRRRVRRGRTLVEHMLTQRVPDQDEND